MLFFNLLTFCEYPQSITNPITYKNMVFYVAKHSVLVVDDDWMFTGPFKKNAERKLDVEVTVANDLNAARKAIETKEFDLVLSDLKIRSAFDGTNSLDFLMLCQRLYPKTRLLVLSGLDSAVHLKGVRYLMKPVIVKRLFDEIRDLLKSKRVKRERIYPRQFQGLVHVSSTGKKTILNLFHQHSTDAHTLDAIKQGWRPTTGEFGAEKLRTVLSNRTKNVSTSGQATIHKIQHNWNEAHRKALRKMHRF